MTAQVPEGDLDFPRLKSGGAVQLIVHGCGGAPPAEMLDMHDVHQVTGDRISGMWRPRNGERREAYSWGALTRRPLFSALWLLLMPFALANVAGWMALRREQDRPHWAMRYQQALVRAFGLLCTWAYVLFVAQIAMDLAAWQCVQADTCRIGGWWSKVSWLDGQPARAAALAAIVPAVLVGVLWLVTHVSRSRYENYSVDAGAQRDDGPLDVASVGLDNRRMWTGRANSTHRVWLHLCSSLVVVALLLTSVARDGGRWATLASALHWTAWGLLGISIWVAGGDRFGRRILRGVRGTTVFAVAAVFTVVCGYVAFGQPAPASRSQIMPGVLWSFNLLMITAYAIVILLLVAVAFAGWPVKAARGWLKGIPAPLVTMTVGMWLLFAVWSGTVISVARLLNPRVVPLDDIGENALFYPVPYVPLARLSLAGLVIVLLATTIHSLRHRMQERTRFGLGAETGIWDRTTLDNAVPGTPQTSWLKAVRKRKRGGEIIAHAETGVGVMTLIAVVAAISYSLWFGYQWLGGDLLWPVLAVVVMCTALTTAAALTGRDRLTALHGFGALLVIAAGAVGAYLLVRPLWPQDPPPTPTQVDLSWLPVGFVTLLLTAIPAGLMLLLRSAMRNRRTLSYVAVIWDIVTFWPRSFHPLAPPSYAERAVPELTERLQQLSQPGQAVLVQGHSQGSVVTMCALAQLDSHERISVVTYGSPIDHLYAHWFPSYVHSEIVKDVRWVNFYRHTDPVGHSPLFGAAPDMGTMPATPAGDVLLPDPPSDKHRLGDGEPRVRGHAHAGYMRQSLFAEHVRAELDRLEP